ncbi:DUF1672 family protein [Rossellomorea marisflavi]|uniref:DUF1672 family protein n=1 Tax=Rossellomorea marisflavi TaxID=189381 RepID=UPI00064E7D8A|nr:DUF1672 family protein [Rossellomorea marisflavi]KML02908.1 hypothetical protein VL06_14625 [Rossellomorea marisflavi]
MKHKWKLFVCGISISLLLGGCFGVDSGKKSEAKKTDTKQGELDRPEDVYESVLTYTGDGYDLPGGEENEKIAKKHKDEVVKATKDYLKKEYSTDVEVHNMVGNQDGVTVFYESTGNLHFYSTAIVPIDTKAKKVLKDEVTTIEGEVERSIKTALYALMMPKEFNELDDQIAKILKETPSITGRTEKAIQNVGGSGYMSPYYYVQSSSLDEGINAVYEKYLKEPNASKEEFVASYDDSQFEPDFLLYNIHFFMKDPNAQPEKKIFNNIIEIFEKNNNLPRGRYLINLNDNYIHIRTSEGYKQNSLSQNPREGIIKN